MWVHFPDVIICARFYLYRRNSFFFGGGGADPRKLGVLISVLSTTTQVNGKVGNSTLAPSGTAEVNVTYICIFDYVAYAKFHHDTVITFPHPQICENAHQVTASFYRAACNADAV